MTTHPTRNIQNIPNIPNIQIQGLSKPKQRICACHNDTRHTQLKLLSKYNSRKIPDDGSEIKIGINFHICFHHEGANKVENDIEYSIDMLNRDFAKSGSNFDSGNSTYRGLNAKTYKKFVKLAAATNISFYKAATIYNPVEQLDTSNISIMERRIKRASPPVRPESYLNIWVADIISGILGYAQFPWDADPEYDGVIIAKDTFGRNPDSNEFHLNKTMTHEIGHWLGLYHTFQETFDYAGGNIDYAPGSNPQELKGDCVIDTPPQRNPTTGNPYYKPNRWPKSQPIDEKQSYQHMFMNFMDYTDDIALFMFTKDQVTKMRQMIFMYRPGVGTIIPSFNYQDRNETRIVAKSDIPSVLSTSSDGLVITSITPVIKPESIPKVVELPLAYDFESNILPPGCKMALLNNNLIGTDIAFTKTYFHSGSQCIRTRRHGKIEFRIDLTGLTEAYLTIYVKTNNPYTHVWTKSPGLNRSGLKTAWFVAKIDESTQFEKYVFALNPPFDSMVEQVYTIRLGTNGDHTGYAYFDGFMISSTPHPPVKPKLNSDSKLISRLWEKSSKNLSKLAGSLTNLKKAI